MSYEETDQYPMLRQRRGPSKDQWEIWGTWLIRAFIPAIAILAWKQNQSMQALQITIAKMSMQQDYQTQQLSQHSAQIERLWQELRKP